MGPLGSQPASGAAKPRRHPRQRHCIRVASQATENSKHGRASERVRCPNVMTVRAQASVTISDSTDRDFQTRINCTHTIRWIRQRDCVRGLVARKNSIHPTTTIHTLSISSESLFVRLCTFAFFNRLLLFTNRSSLLRTFSHHLKTSSPSSKAVLAIIHRPSSIVHLYTQRCDGHLILASNAAATAIAATLLGPREAGLGHHRPKLS